MAAPQPVASPRRSRGFSLRSENSHNSSNSGQKKTHHRTESAEEKAKRNLHTKADPMVAMSEDQPSMCPYLPCSTCFFGSRALSFLSPLEIQSLLVQPPPHCQIFRSICIHDPTDRSHLVTVALEKSNLGSLREMEHKDQYGNPISSLAPPPQLKIFGTAGKEVRH